MLSLPRADKLSTALGWPRTYTDVNLLNELNIRPTIAAGCFCRQHHVPTGLPYVLTGYVITRSILWQVKQIKLRCQTFSRKLTGLFTNSSFRTPLHNGVSGVTLGSLKLFLTLLPCRNIVFWVKLWVWMPQHFLSQTCSDWRRLLNHTGFSAHILCCAVCDLWTLSSTGYKPYTNSHERAEWSAASIPAQVQTVSTRLRWV